jgi:hypothetical protein
MTDEKSPEYVKADSRVQAISERALRDADDAIRELPQKEQANILGAWFGQDLVDIWQEWLLEGEESAPWPS